MSSDSVVGALCMFIAGILIGISIPSDPVPAPRPTYHCPVAQGHEVVSTIDSRDGQFCVYANSFGRATHKIRVAQ